MYFHVTPSALAKPIPYPTTFLHRIASELRKRNKGPKILHATNPAQTVATSVQHSERFWIAGRAPTTTKLDGNMHDLMMGDMTISKYRKHVATAQRVCHRSRAYTRHGMCTLMATFFQTNSFIKMTFEQDLQ